MVRPRSIKDYRKEGAVHNLFNRVLMVWLEQNGYCPTHANLSAVDRIKSILQNKLKVKAQLQFSFAINEVLNANAKNNDEIKEMRDEIESDLNKLVEETFFAIPKQNTNSSGTFVISLIISIIALVLAGTALSISLCTCAN